jgi:hypothetical protein
VRDPNAVFGMAVVEVANEAEARALADGDPTARGHAPPEHVLAPRHAPRDPAAEAVRFSGVLGFGGGWLFFADGESFRKWALCPTG